MLRKTLAATALTVTAALGLTACAGPVSRRQGGSASPWPLATAGAAAWFISAACLEMVLSSLRVADRRHRPGNPLRRSAMGSDVLDINTLLGMGPMAPVANPYPLYRRLRDESPVLSIRSTADAQVAGNHRSVMLTRYADVKAVLGIPDDWETVALIPVGRPLGRFGPVRRVPSAQVTHWDCWGNPRRGAS